MGDVYEERDVDREMQIRELLGDVLSTDRYAVLWAAVLRLETYHPKALESIIFDLELAAIDPSLITATKETP